MIFNKIKKITILLLLIIINISCNKKYDLREEIDVSEKIVEDLFSAFMEDCRLLPMDLRQEIDFCSTIADKADKICTYIANMTDAFAVEEHQKMFNISYRF